MKTSFHIHANHFGEKLPRSFADLEGVGFSAKAATIFSDKQPSPLWLMGAFPHSAAERDDVYSQALEIIKNDNSFLGYMEHETLTPNFTNRFEPTEFIPKVLFPIQKSVSLTPGKKRADVHVFREHGEPDELDKILASKAFYEVHTTNSKIWTLLIQSMPEFHYLQSVLPEYFEKVGGIKKLEFEIVGRVDVCGGFEPSLVTDGRLHKGEVVDKIQP